MKTKVMLRTERAVLLPRLQPVFMRLCKTLTEHRHQSAIPLIITALVCSIGAALADLATIDQAVTEYQETLARWERSINATTDPALKARIARDKPSPRKTSAVIMQALTPALDQPAALRGIRWIYKYDPSFLSGAEETSSGTVLRNALRRDLYKYAGAGELCYVIAQSFTPQDLPFLEKVAAQSPSPEDQGLAALALSLAHSSLGDDPALLAKRLKNIQRAIKLLPADTMVEGKKATDILDDQIYVITNLTKGRVSPALSGRDLGGRPVSWQAGTGKVTALVFWSEEDLQQEALLEVFQGTKELLDEVGGEMIGIYRGSEAQLSTLITDRKISWKNIYDQNKQVFKTYRIQHTPVVFVLDKAGKIQSVSEPNALANLSIRALANSSE